jgi:hypothetical protein
VPILTSEKTDFMTKNVSRDKGHFIMNKGSIYQEDIIIINICALDTRSSKYMKQKLTELKKERSNSTVTEIATSHFQRIEQAVDQHENRRLGQYCKSTRCNKHPLNIPINSDKIHVLFKFTWNNLQHS